MKSRGTQETRLLGLRYTTTEKKLVGGDAIHSLYRGLSVSRSLLRSQAAHGHRAHASRRGRHNANRARQKSKYSPESLFFSFFGLYARPDEFSRALALLTSRPLKRRTSNPFINEVKNFASETEEL
jgi:hypothetical protein